MGTRKSRHNKGRKPFYKEHRLTYVDAQALRGREDDFEIGRPRYMSGLLLKTRTWWSDSEKAALRRFIGGGYSPDEIAPVLGRSPSSLLCYARHMRLAFPRAPKHIAAARFDPPMAYPYVSKSRSDADLLLEVIALVPRAFPEQMRADICQDLLLNILEGRCTLDQIRSHRQHAAWFVRKFWRDNFEQSGRAVSLDDHGGEYTDTLLRSRLARDWRDGEINDRRRAYEAMPRFTAPDQIDAVYVSQVERERERLASTGLFIDFEEAIDSLEDRI